MSELTELTLAEARDLLRKREFSAVELTDAQLSAVSKARVLNAFVLETADKARAMARASQARLQKGDVRPLEGIPLGVKDMFATADVRTTACSHILDNFVPTYESTVTEQLWRDGAVMLGKLNNDEFVFWARGVSVASQGIRNQACAWRFVRRLGGRSCCASLLRRDGHRHGRVDPTTGGIRGGCRHQAHLRPLLPMGHRGVRVLA
jgi:aspartyl-tRNA(Asn)/glutamyl-tRNA(Gln) amidotransferase subunit A